MSPASEPAQLRFDGIYYRATAGVTQLLRFFPDGTVVGTSIATTRPGGHAGWLRRWWHAEKSSGARLDPREMAVRASSWLNAEWSQQRGAYTVAGSELDFFLVSGTSRVEYRGTIAADGLLLDAHSHALGHRTTNVPYDFVQLTS